MYQRLLSSGSQRPSRGGGGVRARARAWVLLRWAALQLGCAARRRPRAEAGLGGALREGLGRRTGEEGKEELGGGGGGGRGRGGGGV